MSMYCNSCGKKINDDDVFCPFCGASQERTSSNNESVEVNKQPNKTVPVNKTDNKSRNILFGLIALLFISAIGLLLFFLLKTTSIDLTKELDITFEGADGYGNVSATNNLENDPSYAKVMKKASAIYNMDYSKMSEKNIQKMYDYELIMSVRNTCSFYDEDGSSINNGQLKNGDMVVYSCELNDLMKDAAKRQKVSFKNTSKAFKVEGLTELKEIDLFDGIEVYWEIADGYPALMLDTSKCTAASLLDIDYEVYNYSSGTATVYANTYQDALISKGYIAKDEQYSKEIECDEEPVMVTSTTDDEVKRLAQSITDKLLISDLEGCKYKLTDSDKEKSIKHEGNDIGYGFSRIYESWSQLYVEYTVIAGDKKVSRQYPVTVYKMADGSYKAFSNYVAGNSGCKISWGDDWSN